jgi:hypothetical protein
MRGGMGRKGGWVNPPALALLPLLPFLPHLPYPPI